ncbi:MAG: hypothetical protein ACI9EB_001252 [Pseudomonas sp.]|jgi:hypothetical protein
MQVRVLFGHRLNKSGHPGPLSASQQADAEMWVAA